MEIYLKRTISGFVPLYDSDYEDVKRIKLGEEVKAKITQPRNYKFHKKFMALLNIGFQNQDEIEVFEHFRYIMTMRAGWFDAVETKKGTVYIPKSISFAKMDELEFEKLYNAMIDVIIKLLGSNRETIENEIINFL